jgi:hypothetical protein
LHVAGKDDAVHLKVFKRRGNHGWGKHRSGLSVCRTPTTDYSTVGVKRTKEAADEGCVPLLEPEMEFDPEPGTIVLLGAALVGMAGAGA